MGVNSSSSVSVVQPFQALGSPFSTPTSTPRKLSSPEDPFASYLRMPDENDNVIKVNPSYQLSFTLMHKTSMAVLTISNISDAHTVFHVTAALYPERYDIEIPRGVLGPGRSTAIAIRLTGSTCNDLQALGNLSSDEFIVDTVILATAPSNALVQELQKVDMWPHVPTRYRQPSYQVTAKFTTWSPSVHDL